MATVTIEDLREASGVESYMLFAVDTPDETFNIPMSVLLQYVTEQQNPTPTGSIIMWPSESIPLGYTELDGKSFDTQVFPALGALFPSGVLPDTRGMVLKHQKSGRTILSYEADAIKSHNHTGSASTSVTVSSTNLGTKATDTTGNHAHGANGDGFLVNRGANGTWNPPGGGSIGFIDTTEYAGDHNHTVYIGSHNHSVSASTSISINSNGGSENLVKNVAVKYIVKKA